VRNDITTVIPGISYLESIFFFFFYVFFCHSQLDWESTVIVILKIFYWESSNLSSPKTTPMSSPTWLGIQCLFSFFYQAEQVIHSLFSFYLKKKYFLDSRNRSEWQHLCHPQLVCGSRPNFYKYYKKNRSLWGKNINTLSQYDCRGWVSIWAWAKKEILPGFPQSLWMTKELIVIPEIFYRGIHSFFL
jgi:hypothetical protein